MLRFRMHLNLLKHSTYILRDTAEQEQYFPPVFLAVEALINRNSRMRQIFHAFSCW